MTPDDQEPTVANGRRCTLRPADRVNTPPAAGVADTRASYRSQLLTRAVVAVASIVVVGLGLARGTPLVAVIGVAAVILGGVRFLMGSR